MSEVDLAYAAGIIDGEGCIHVQRAKVTHSNKTQTFAFRLFLQVSQVDRRLAPWLQELFGCGHLRELKARGKDRPQLLWQVLRQQDVISVLSLVRPYLKLKTDLADLALELQSLKNQSVAGHYPKRFGAERQEEIFVEMRTRTRKGLQ